MTRGRILWLIAVMAVLVLAVGAVHEWHTSSGRGSPLVDVLWRVLWIGYTIAKLALLGMLVVAGVRYVANRRNGHEGGPPLG